MGHIWILPGFWPNFLIKSQKTFPCSDGKGEFGADVNLWFVLVNADHFKGAQYAKSPGVTRVDGFDCAGEEGIATVRLEMLQDYAHISK